MTHRQTLHHNIYIVIITAINLITMKMITQVNICRRPARPGESCDTLGLAELGTMCNPHSCAIVQVVVVIIMVIMVMMMFRWSLFFFVLLVMRIIMMLMLMIILMCNPYSCTIVQVVVVIIMVIMAMAMMFGWW